MRGHKDPAQPERKKENNVRKDSLLKKRKGSQTKNFLKIYIQRNIYDTLPHESVYVTCLAITVCFIILVVPLGFIV